MLILMLNLLEQLFIIFEMNLFIIFKKNDFFKIINMIKFV